MKRIVLGLLIALALPGLVFAQAKTASTAAAPQGQSLILEFVDGSDLTVTVGDKILKYGVGITDGDTLPVGSTLKTGPSTTAELKLRPNGTIIKIAKTTTFQVQAVATNAQDKNTFALVAGKVRTIAAKGGQYDFKSQTTVCGVRGTDFAFSVEEGKKEQLMVAKGLVQFQKTDASGNILGDISVAAGQFADAFAAVFEAAKFTAEQFASEYGDVGFQKLLENEVPGNVEEAAPPAEPAAAAPVPAPENVVVTPVTPEEAGKTLAEGASKLTKSDVESAFSKWLREVLGMEIGSVTINGQTYSKAVIQPNFNLGKVKLGLYLPIIYTSDLFNPQDWYHPGGNDEWSFGTDYGWTASTWQEAAIDAASDFALKIKYFEVGRQLEDPFFIKVGNIQDMTLGHGLIMRNYANDTEFPSVRRVGFNIGIDGGFLGIEALSSDLADLENGIYGARLYIRPFGKAFKLAVGLSGVADINPLSSVSSDGTYDPILVGGGLDLDLPIIQSDLLALRLFTDLAAETEYLQGDSDAINKAIGLIYDADVPLSLDSFNNYGLAGGLIARLLMIDFRLEYRYYKGIFQPSLFDSTYDKMRSVYAATYYDYITNGVSSADATVMGIYGEGGFKFLKDKLSFDMGYMWPFDQSITLADSDVNNDVGAYLLKQMGATTDEFHAKLVVKKGLIPVFDVAGSIFYDRKGLAKSIYRAALDSTDVNYAAFQFFDANTTFGGELAVPVPKTPNLDVAVIFAAVPVYNGNVVEVDSDGYPVLKPSISFETRFHF